MKNPPSQIISISILIFCLLFSIYCLVYSGVPVTDDEQLFASAAINLGKFGRLSAGQMEGNARLDRDYHGVGILHPISAAPLASIAGELTLGRVQSLYLITPMFVAASAALVFLIAINAGFSGGTSVLACLAFGLTTIAFPYAKTFFREPLAMVLLLMNVLFIQKIINALKTRTPAFAAWAAFFLSMLGLLMTKLLMIVYVPCAAVILAQKIVIYYKNYKIDLKKVLYSSAALLAGTLLVYYLLSSFLENQLENRLTFSFVWEMLNRIGRLPHDGIPAVIIGSLFSPGKGLFIYSPALILAFFSFKRSADKGWHAQDLAWATLIGMIILQALIYNDKWWNITWGTRYLLPAVPLMILAGLPVMDAWRQGANRSGRFILYLLLILGFIIQIGAVLIDDPTYLAKLYDQFSSIFPDPLVWDIYYAPIQLTWKSLFEGEPINLASWRIFLLNRASVLALTLLIICMMSASIFALRRALTKKLTRKQRLLSIFVSIFIVLTIPGLLLTTYKTDPRHYYFRDDIRNAVADLEHQCSAEDIVLVDHYLSPAWYYLMNFGNLPVKWYSLPIPNEVEEQEPVPDLVQKLLQEQNTEKSHRIWILSENPDIKARYRVDEKKDYCEMELINNQTYTSSLTDENVVLSLYTIKFCDL